MDWFFDGLGTLLLSSEIPYFMANKIPYFLS